MKIDIYFRAFELNDAEFINNLRKINEFESLIGGNKRFVSLAREKKWVEDLIYNDYKDLFYVAICKKENNEIIGYTSVLEIDHVNQSCIWGGIKVHPDYKGIGYGTKAGSLILKFVFEELNMERFSGECLEMHIVSKKLMEKMGLKVEGVKRNSVFKGGIFHNQFIYSILKEEYLLLNNNKI